MKKLFINKYWSTKKKKETFKQFGAESKKTLRPKKPVIWEIPRKINKSPFRIPVALEYNNKFIVYYDNIKEINEYRAKYFNKKGEIQ